MRHEPVVIPITVQRIVCSGCGAEANASCNCGKAYIPAKQRAAEAIAANPQKSNRAIADETGVSEPTVRRARTASHDAVEEPRVGLDGKTRRLPARPSPIEDEEPDIENEIEPDSYRSAFLLRADQAKVFAAYSGPVDREIIAAAEAAVRAWGKLLQHLQERCHG